MQATADLSKKEGSWSGWKGQGKARFPLFSQRRPRFFFIRACGLNIAAWSCVLRPSVVGGDLHVHVCLSIVVVRWNTSVYLHYFKGVGGGHAQMTDLFCLHVQKKKQEEKNKVRWRGWIHAGGWSEEKTPQHAGSHLL